MMIQKHIPLKHVDGSIFVNKAMFADFAELIRTNPTSARALLLLTAFADDNNSVISDVKTVSKLLGCRLEEAKYALRVLKANGYIDIQEVKLRHEHEIMGVQHDKNLYRKSKKKVWKVVGTKLVTSFTVQGTYNRFKIEPNMVKCSNNHNQNNMVKHIDGNLFFDSRIRNDEIIWEL